MNSPLSKNKPRSRSVRRAAPVLAVDLGGTKLAVALVDRRGRIRSRAEAPVDASSRLAPIEQIARMAADIGGGFAAAGVAVPGLVRRDGTVWAPNLPGWTRVPLVRLLRPRLRVPVVVESDRNAGVIGETWRGVARGARDAVVLIVGTGIGAGIVSGGRLVRGAHELSGCAGWIVVGDEIDRRTRRFGSLEALAAGPAIARAAGTRTAREAAGSARRGNRRARRAFARAARVLGLAVGNVISLFDPDVIVLTGGVTGAADLIAAELRRVALERAQPLAAKQVAIRFSRLGSDANLLGVAKLAIEDSTHER